MNEQTGAWSTEHETGDPNNFLLVRVYEGGTMTASAKVDGSYGPEFTLSPEAGWFDQPTSLTVVSA